MSEPLLVRDPPVGDPMWLADLATGRERQSATGKRSKRTKHDFRCPICPSAICQASCLICTSLSTDVPVLLLNQPIIVK